VRLAARLWLLGAVVPFLGTVLALLVAAEVFRVRLEAGVDDALRAQAATESVSLFDGPGGKTHLHMDASPLRRDMGRLVPAAALYGPGGERVVMMPKEAAEAWTSPVLDPALAPDHPLLLDRTAPDGGRLRVLRVAVRRPEGDRYALEMAASLAPVDHDVGAFYSSALVMAAVLGAVLLALQSVLARRLSTRVKALTRHMGALREGDLDAAPPPAQGRDEIADLARVVADATERLRLAREAQDRLVGEAAHELRTPLTLMRTSIDLALRRRREAPELIAALEGTREEVDRLARLATRLLDLATAGRGKWDRAPGDLRAVAAEAAEASRAAAEEKGLLIVLEAPVPVHACFDAHGIRQALDNLLSNAIRYSPPNRTVTVSARELGAVVQLSVSDLGPGIPPADRERVFEAFERGERDERGEPGRAGVGLGLAIVREVARGHSGRAYVADSERGATVVIELRGSSKAAGRGGDPTPARAAGNTR
jgi:signal transduction histidine kinase